MSMENDCRQYLVPLNELIEGQMGIVISNWDNTDEKEDFELEWGQTTAFTCKDATSIISNFSVNTWGSTEEMDDDGVEPDSGFLKFTINENGNDYSKYLTTKSWSSAKVKESGKCVEIEGNNSLFLRNEESFDDEAIFKTYLLGGAIEYDVDISETKSSCVAGMYMVHTDDGMCGEVDQYGRPMCQSIDAMQANLFGFESKAHPCGNGTCDAISKCIVSMQDQGIDKYGSGAYGPGGSIIDTQD